MWPWKRETRATDMTALLIQQLQSNASGENVEAGIAAIETAVGLWGRAFASARVEPDTPVTRALTPGLLGLVGRSLVSPGDLVLELEVEEGELVLQPVGTWSVVGGRRGPRGSTRRLSTGLRAPSAARSTGAGLCISSTATGRRGLGMDGARWQSRPRRSRSRRCSSSVSTRRPGLASGLCCLCPRSTLGCRPISTHCPARPCLSGRRRATGTRVASRT